MNEINCPEEKVLYGWISPTKKTCTMWTEDYNTALHFAKSEVTKNHPQYIVEKTEHYEIVGKVSK